MGLQLVLSLFPGIDIFGRAFEAEGFCVVRGPDLLLGQDIRDWHAPSGKFDGVIGGDPCQAHSVAITSRGGPSGASQQDLTSEFERIIHEAQPKWWVRENVPGAPDPKSLGFKSIQFDAWEVGASQHRTRKFWSNLSLCIEKWDKKDRHPDPWPCVTATEYKASPGSNERVMRQRASRKVGRRMTLEEVNEAMGLPSDFSTPAFLQSASYQVRGNAVPLLMGLAVARAVKISLGI